MDDSCSSARFPRRSRARRARARDRRAREFFLYRSPSFTRAMRRRVVARIALNRAVAPRTVAEREGPSRASPRASSPRDARPRPRAFEDGSRAMTMTMTRAARPRGETASRGAAKTTNAARGMGAVGRPGGARGRARRGIVARADVDPESLAILQEKLGQRITFEGSGAEQLNKGVLLDAGGRAMGKDKGLAKSEAASRRWRSRTIRMGCSRKWMSLRRA